MTFVILREENRAKKEKESQNFKKTLLVVAESLSSSRVCRGVKNVGNMSEQFENSLRTVENS